MSNWTPTDPFNLVKEEVQKSISGLQLLHKQWKEANDNDEESWLKQEIFNIVRNIMSDLEDLELATDRVKKDGNNGRFKEISPADIQQRYQFIEETRNYIRDIENEVSSAAPRGNATRHNRNMLGVENVRNAKYAALDREIHEDHTNFVRSQQQLQHEMYNEQEEGLREVSIAVDTLHGMSTDMKDTLDKQHKQLNKFDEEITKTSERVGKAIKRVDALLTKADQKMGWWIIGVLLIALLILFVLLFVIN